MGPATTSTFEVLGNAIIRRSPGIDVKKGFTRKYRSLFGVTPEIASVAWNEIEENLPRACIPLHLLWCCLFLKVYGSEAVHCTIVNVDPKTFRKWSWIVVSALSSLQIVSSSLVPLCLLIKYRLPGAAVF